MLNRYNFVDFENKICKGMDVPDFREEEVGK